MDVNKKVRRMITPNLEINNNAFLFDFFKILKDKTIETVFQPIISLRDGEIYGYEALSRGPQGGELRSPDVLFEYAYNNDATWELELICRTKAIENASRLKIKTKLFINVSPHIMQDQKFQKGFTKEYIDSTLFNSQNIIFEITEKEAVKNIQDFTKTIQNYKNQNYMIAIDDAGAGYSGLNLISDLRPHFIKLDMNLIRNIDTDVTKQSLVKSMREFASLTNTFLIAEGIETRDELIKVIEIGVHYGQGYFIQKPNESIFPIEEQVKEIIKETNRKKNHFYGMKLSDVYISNISKSVRSISPLMLVSQVYEMMKKDISCHGFCVTDNEKVMGVITRNEFFKRTSGLYGYNLYGSKPVIDIMEENFLQVDYKDTVNIVAKKAMQRSIDKIYDFITLTKDGRYYGIVTVKDLLEKTIEMEVFNAKHLNPLSELPGNVLIEKEIEAVMNPNEKAHILYFDLDNFKSYNDVYGFENGDRVLKFFTRILKDYIPDDEFIGHIGGDDFIAIIKKNQGVLKESMEKMINEFDKSIIYFYNQNDIDKGFIIAKNRHGIEESFPLLTVSIVGVDSCSYPSSYALSEDIGRLKKECKQLAGSCFIYR